MPTPITKSIPITTTMTILTTIPIPITRLKSATTTIPIPITIPIPLPIPISIPIPPPIPIPIPLPIPIPITTTITTTIPICKTTHPSMRRMNQMRLSEGISFILEPDKSSPAATMGINKNLEAMIAAICSVHKQPSEG